LNRGKILALDVGLARIGVATCDPLWLTVRPLTVIHRTSRRADFERLARLATQEETTAVVCGLPLNMDGSEGVQAQSVRKWAMRLAQALRTLLGRPLPIIFWDERLSTFAAQEWIDSGSHEAEDALAAALILESYLTAQRRGETLNFGRIELKNKHESQ
jgi:putative Holliday junction resolvase